MKTGMRGVFAKAKFVGLLGLGLAMAGLGGCINQGQYDRLYELNRSLTASNAELDQRLKECQLAGSQMGNSLGKGETTLSGLQRENSDLRSQLDKSLADFRNLDSRIAGLSIGPLDSETSRQLEALEDQYPGIISFDAARGMLRVSSDLTFDSGQAIVKDSAKQALNALSNVLKSGSATQYEIIVEGHTDSQKIASDATRRLHPTNRHLSAHRAISVIDTLGSMGVNSDRMMAAGWGEYRPAVANSANGNTRENRRVEIYLAKSSASAMNTPGKAPMNPVNPVITPVQGANPGKSSQMDMTK